MYGASFKVRHKEWFKESLSLMFKTLPWIILMFMVFYGIISLSHFVMSPIAESGSKLLKAISFVIPLTIAIVIIVFSPITLAAMIIMHKIDQGYKSDPITLGYFILHDKTMWLSHLRAGFKDFGMAIACIMGVGVAIALTSLNSPVNPEEAKAAHLIAYELFWKAHPNLKMLNNFMGTVSIGIIPFIMLYEYKGRSKFNIFMAANSYRTIEECALDAASTKDRLDNLVKLYVFLPQIFIILVISMLNIGYPVISIVINIVQFVISIWVLHMHYIIGRDYYIGPPPKKQKQENEDKSMQTA